MSFPVLFAMFFVFIVIHNGLFFFVQSLMRGVGYKTSLFFSRWSDLGIPFKYLQIRRRYGWSPWPVYVMWSSLILAAITMAMIVFVNLRS
jgi:hypothetical protein